MSQIYSFFSVLVLSFFAVPVAYSDVESGKEGILVEDLVSVRDIKAFQLSPDGNRVALQIVVANYESNIVDVSWYVAGLNGQERPIRIATGAEPGGNVYQWGTPIGGVRPSEMAWGPDGEQVYFTRRVLGEFQIWRSSTFSQRAEQVTFSEYDVQGPKLSEDGTDLFYSVGRKRSEIATRNEADAKIGHLARMPPTYSVEYGPIWPLCLADMSERWVFESNESRACSLRVLVQDLSTGEVKPASDSERTFYFGVSESSLVDLAREGQKKERRRAFERQSPANKTVAYFANVDPGRFKGFRPPMQLEASIDGAIVVCEHQACTSTKPLGIWWTSAEDEIVFQARDGRRNTLTSFYAWSPFTGKLRTLFSGDDLFRRCEKVRKRLICSRQTWTTPDEIVSLDINTGEVIVLVDFNPTLKSKSFTTIEKLFSRDQFGNLAHAHLVYPKNYTSEKTYPLVVVQYRSHGFLRGGVGDEHPIHVLADHGMAVLSFDDPGLSGLHQEEDDIVELNIRGRRHVMVDHGPAVALERMIDDLVARGIVDRDRVGITGFSNGATIMDTAILRRNYAAASSHYSMMSPPNFEQSSKSEWGQMLNGAFGGTPFSEVGFKNRAENSVGVNVARIDTPLLIQVSDREYHIARQNYHALEEAEKAIEMWIFPDAYHTKWQPAHRYNVYRRNLQWFKFWLKSEEAEDPVDPEQYVRWRELRHQHEKNLSDKATIQ